MSRTNFNLDRLAKDFFFFDSLPLLRRELPLSPSSMKGHVKNKLQPRRLAKDSFMDSLPLLRRELPLSPSYPQLFSLRASRGRCGSFGESCYFSFRFLRGWSYLKRCRCFGSLG